MRVPLDVRSNSSRPRSVVDNRSFIEEYLRKVRFIARTLSADDIDRTIELLFDAWENGRQVFVCGNGGSASTATHFACDLLKTTATDGKRGLRAECLNDNIPLMLALVNDDGFENLFLEQLKTKFRQGDVLICISVHGGAGKDKAGLWSQNLLKAMRYVQDMGGKTVGLSGFDGGPMKEIADACVVVPIDSTPLVESFHLVLEHLFCSCLKEKIGAYEEKSGIPR
jgi:D-sedoheptulose 7-phosphate isomerase